MLSLEEKLRGECTCHVRRLPECKDANIEDRPDA